MSEKKIFQAQAVISKATTLEDFSVRLTVDCQELSGEEMAILFSSKGKAGWFLFSEQELKQEDIKDLPDIKMEENTKSPSQRLRGRMFIYYTHLFGKEDGFYNWYQEQMEKIGQKYLDKMQ